MKKILCLLFVFLLVIGLVQAAVYVKFEGIDGEANDPGREGWIVINSFSHGVGS